MSRYSLMIILLILQLGMGCDEDGCSCDSGPFYADLKIKLTIDEENPEVLLHVFEGKIERGDTIISEWVDQSVIYYELEADKYYSAIVEYRRGSKRIIAIDGKKMSLSSDDCNCDYATNISLNLRLNL